MSVSSGFMMVGPGLSHYAMQCQAANLSPLLASEPGSESPPTARSNSVSSRKFNDDTRDAATTLRHINTQSQWYVSILYLHYLLEDLSRSFVVAVGGGAEHSHLIVMLALPFQCRLV